MKNICISKNITTFKKKKNIESESEFFIFFSY